MITQILNGIKRLLLGETYKFATRKGSTSLSGASWTEIYRETLEYPTKLISIEFLTEKDITTEYRIVVDGEKIFPFGDFSVVENGVTRNFMLPISVAAGSFLQVEMRSDINNKNVVILNELAVVEIR